ncbi:uncharacterized protein BJ171DRAFT_38565 [Polychytrium aggregatum]|uniref:uncharacterized protein n=1 Tax=Polychytrium aggregatum TaxID=110093 RepID=UPI0022FE5FCA|nr:uncharacterized protein BJ171DRAFT_38565 [Polychytrium aggregatum]KAI9190832.1 hypothetical protein BJ171DRAFT_38565 [Polychytrium aggregatum]
MGIQDLAIVPQEGKPSIVRGFLGLTPDIAFAGDIVYYTSKSSRPTLASLFLSLNAYILTNVQKDESADDDNPHHTQTTYFLKRQVFIAGDSSVTDPQSAPRKSSAYLELSSSECHRFPFSIELGPDIVPSLPGSFTWDYSKNASASVVYELTATLITAPKLLRSAKVITTSEIVDVPKVDPPNVIKGETTATNIVHQGVNEFIQYNIHLDRSIFGLRQPVGFQIVDISPRSNDIKINGLSVKLVQHAVIKSAGIAHEFDTVLNEIPEGSSAFTQASSVRWSGAGELIVEKAHRREKNIQIDALSAMELETVIIWHSVAIEVHIKQHSSVCLEIPVWFMDIDDETRKWVVKHCGGVKPEALVGSAFRKVR